MSAEYWKQPARWNVRAMREGRRFKVFCASIADVFDNQVDPAWRADLWRVIGETPNLDWLLLTKRPQNIAGMLPGGWGAGWPNVWMGTSVENQQEANRRIPYLELVPAVMHFLSAEPLLEYFDANYIGIDWVIVGGESGPGARETNLGDIDRLVRNLIDAGVFVFVKQLGSNLVGSYRGGMDRIRLKDPKGGDPMEWPQDLQVREFPR